MRTYFWDEEAGMCAGFPSGGLLEAATDQPQPLKIG
jgi:hypothetical protein